MRRTTRSYKKDARLYHQWYEEEHSKVKQLEEKLLRLRANLNALIRFGQGYEI